MNKVKIRRELNNIIEMTEIEELFHDGIEIDIRTCAEKALKILDGEDE